MFVLYYIPFYSLCSWNHFTFIRLLPLLQWCRACLIVVQSSLFAVQILGCSDKAPEGSLQHVVNEVSGYFFKRLQVLV